MSYLFKLIVEGLINNCKIFDNNIANIVVASLALFIAYIPAWDSTHNLYRIGFIKSKNSGSASHWIVRGSVAFLFILAVKVIWNIISFIKNNIAKILLIMITSIIVYFLILQCEKAYNKRKQKN